VVVLSGESPSPLIYIIFLVNQHMALPHGQYLAMETSNLTYNSHPINQPYTSPPLTHQTVTIAQWQSQAGAYTMELSTHTLEYYYTDSHTV